MSLLSDHLQPLDVDALRASYRAAHPFPFVAIDGLLRPEYARETAAACPTVEEAHRIGRTFRAVNETGKTQVTDPQHFPEPIRRLNELMAHPEWLALVSSITGIPSLLADDELVGGGIHVMGPGSHLDVHVDFNVIEDRALHRRLNILLFLNEGWPSSWGGALELWDEPVQVCHHAFPPELNRCVLFETSEHSFHGVQKVSCPPMAARRSFAAYYYTREAPAGWDGRHHTTVFRARPSERFKGSVLMPVERLWRQARRGVRRAASRVRRGA